MENKSEKRIHAQKLADLFSSMPVSKKVKLQETRDIVTTLNVFLKS